MKWISDLIRIPNHLTILKKDGATRYISGEYGMKYPAGQSGTLSTYTSLTSGGNTLHLNKTWKDEDVLSYINNRFDELNKLIELRTAFSFVLISAFADFLCCSIANKKCSQLKEFFDGFVSYVGKNDKNISKTLSEILRDGSVHNLSVNPHDWQIKVSKGKLYYVVLTHKANCKTCENLSINAKNELILVAEDMVDGLRDYIISKYSDPVVMQNMVKWFNKNSPIYLLSPSEETPNVEDQS